MKYKDLLKIGIKITSPFGNRLHPVTKQPDRFHNGIDIATPIGTPIYAPDDGKVDWLRSDEKGGLMMRATLKNGYTLGFAHLDKFNPDLQVAGSKFAKGKILAYTGNSGASTGPHLHLTVRKNEELLDPQKVFSL